MSIEKPELESFSQQVALEGCVDPQVSTEQIEALQVSDIEVFKGAVRIAGATVKFTHLKHPNPSDNVKKLIGTGYLAAQGAYKPYAINLALEGNDVVMIKPPRHQALRNQLSQPHMRDVLLLQAQAQYALMRYFGDDVYDTYGHSMGFDTNLRVAEQKPERIRSMIGAGGAGINGRNSVISMALKGVQVIKGDIRQSIPTIHHYAGARLALDEAVHILSNPIRAGREGISVARADNVAKLERAAANGINLGCILFEKDIFFGVESVLAATKHVFGKNILITPGATHVYTQDHPAEHAIDVSQMFSDLSKPATRFDAA